MKNNKKIIIAAGGTAGHIYPAVSIIEHIREKYTGTSMLFIGTSRGMEKDTAAELDIGFKAIKATGFTVNRNFFKKFVVILRFFVNFLAGFFSSVKIITGFKPDIIIGMGGYVCAPVLSAAIFLRVPFALHEQNSIPGRLNSFFSRFARFTFISFESSRKLFSKKSRVIFSGNPIRKAVSGYRTLKPEYDSLGLDEGRKTIVAFGGSLGAEKINTSVLGLYSLLKDEKNLQIVLISGKRFYGQCSQRLENMYEPGAFIIFKIIPYIYEIEKLYRIADIVISRAGAITIAELDYTRIPAILVPYPQAIGDHQLYNAAYLADKKMADIIPDDKLDSGILVKQIKNILNSSIKDKKETEFAPEERMDQYTDPAQIISGFLTGERL
jgi:UDP-N-acetylglucosamine--N-acetylmuramyl-(pentapeptide) pyrophosphoryl-undecaprenol N-acetylglucosamine transferase